MTLRLVRGPDDHPLVEPIVKRAAHRRSLVRSVGTGLAMALAVMMVGTPFYGFGVEVFLAFAGVASVAGVGVGIWCRYRPARRLEPSVSNVRCKLCGRDVKKAGPSSRSGKPCPECGV